MRSSAHIYIIFLSHPILNWVFNKKIKGQSIHRLDKLPSFINKNIIHLLFEMVVPSFLKEKLYIQRDRVSICCETLQLLRTTMYEYGVKNQLIYNNSRCHTSYTVYTTENRTTFFLSSLCLFFFYLFFSPFSFLFCSFMLNTINMT